MSPSDEEIGHMIENSGGRIGRHPDGREEVSLPLDAFKQMIRSLVEHAANNHQLVAALVRQAGGLVELDTQFVRDTEPGLIIEEIGEPKVTMIRIKDMAH